MASRVARGQAHSLAPESSAPALPPAPRRPSTIPRCFACCPVLAHDDHRRSPGWRAGRQVITLEQVITRMMSGWLTATASPRSLPGRCSWLSLGARVRALTTGHTEAQHGRKTVRGRRPSANGASVRLKNNPAKGRADQCLSRVRLVPGQLPSADVRAGTGSGPGQWWRPEHRAGRALHEGLRPSS